MGSFTQATLLLVLVTVTTAQEPTSLQLWVHEGPVYRIHAEAEFPLTVSLLYNTSHPEEVAEVAVMQGRGSLLRITPKLKLDWKLVIKNESVVFSAEDIVEGNNKTFTISSYYWGYVSVSFYAKREVGPLHEPLSESADHGGLNPANYTLNRTAAEDENNIGVLIMNDTIIIVDRQKSSKLFDNIFIGVATCFMLINTINMGCQLDLKIIKSVLQKPVGPLCGVISQFMFMPLFSFTVGLMLLDNPLHRLGLFTLGCSPGGAMSNLWTLLFNGDLNLSITMTFVSTLLAMGMMPFWMYTLGSRLLGDNNISIPYGNLAMSLLALTIPVGIGLLIKYKKRKWAEISYKIVKPMTFCMIIFFITVGSYNSHKALQLMTWKLVLAGFMVSMGGYSAGALLSKLFCLKKKQIIAISIETAFQNAAIAFIMLKLSLPTPESDIAAVPVMAQLLQTGPPILTCFLIWQCLQRCGICLPDPPETQKDELSERKDVDNANAKFGGRNGLTDAVRDELNEKNSAVTAELMGVTDDDDVPRTPQLLYDPSLPLHLRQKTNGV